MQTSAGQWEDQKAALLGMIYKKIQEDQKDQSYRENNSTNATDPHPQRQSVYGFCILLEVLVFRDYGSFYGASHCKTFAKTVFVFDVYLQIVYFGPVSKSDPRTSNKVN